MKKSKIIYSAILFILPSWIKIKLMRLFGAKIGAGTVISIFSYVCADSIIIGCNSKIFPFSFISCRFLKIGNRVQIKPTVVIDTVSVAIGHDSILMEQVVIGGMKTSRSSIDIGARVKIFPFSFLNPTEPITIEDEVGVGGANYIFTHGSWQSALDGFPIAFGPVTIRKGVWLPWRVFIMPNVEIGEFSTIGANSLVNKSIPPNSLAAGSPAKIISSDGAYLRPKNVDEKIEYLKIVFRDMLEFMQFEHARVESEFYDNGILAKIVSHGVLDVFEFAANEKKFVDDCTVFVSFLKIEPQLKHDLLNNDCAWFDISERVCYLGDRRFSKSVRDFMGRYGLRFSIWGE